MDLVKHAKDELGRLHKLEKDLFIHEKVVEAVSIFDVFDDKSDLLTAQNLFIRLICKKNLAPLTDHPDEWLLLEESGLWQSKRNMFAFSKDGGKTYYELDVRDPKDRSKYLIQETRSHKND